MVWLRAVMVMRAIDTTTALYSVLTDLVSFMLSLEHVRLLAVRCSLQAIAFSTGMHAETAWNT